ncbi:MAG: T9SS type A sorting domain-containing protein, partial [Crocinitomicaceae bacterium]|nr:T9SS type A sorting domain-containing protein [Crocinitomicaceae bacterium]
NAYNKGEAVFKLYSTQGELMETKVLNCTPGANRFSVNLANQASGVYMFTLTTNNKSYSERIIKN